MRLGVNLCFAVKRMLDPVEWATFVRDDLGLSEVQFTFDLLNPWTPTAERTRLARKVRTAADECGLTLHSAVVGLADYVPGGLLDPDPDARAAAATWWRRAVDLTVELGVTAVGGPLGSMSAAHTAEAHQRARRWDDLVTVTTSIIDYATRSGVGEFLIEPTPINREVPSTIAQCERLLADLSDRGADAGILLDSGHTVYEPLYGEQAAFSDWTSALGSAIKTVHLDNTDRRGDPHWGWPHEHGALDIETIIADLRTAGLSDVPLMLEVFPRFEDDDEAVRAMMRATVGHCRAALAAAGASA